LCSIIEGRTFENRKKAHISLENTARSTSRHDFKMQVLVIRVLFKLLECKGCGTKLLIFSNIIVVKQVDGQRVLQRSNNNIDGLVPAGIGILVYSFGACQYIAVVDGDCS